MIHLVATKTGRDYTTKCGAKAGPDEVTMWYTEATCYACRPYEYVKDDDGNLVKRERVEPTTPKTKVLRRRSRR
jgi:hypothetical protein